MRIDDIAAPIASGSFKTKGMIVAPCSVRTMSEIATGVTTILLTRAADVMLKERRPLILMVRETPLHLGHLRTMAALAEMGAIILPPVPAFYAEPKTLSDLVDQMVGRALDLLGYEWPDVQALGRRHRQGQRRKRRRAAAMNEQVTKPDEVAARAKLATLMQEHRDLDAAIEALSAAGNRDQLALSRLKKRKLQLKDEITEINNQLLPDIIA